MPYTYVGVFADAFGRKCRIYLSEPSDAMAKMFEIKVYVEPLLIFYSQWDNVIHESEKFRLACHGL